MAWRVPVTMIGGNGVARVEGSTLLDAQRDLAAVTNRVLASVAADVRTGLAETVGVRAALDLSERASVIIDLPSTHGDFQPDYIARAIDMENVEAWCDEANRVHVALCPWYSTKDVDQVVLAITKVVHVLLGLHATDAQQTGADDRSSLWRRLLTGAAEIAALQKSANRK